MIQRLARRHGDVFTLNLPIYGRVVVVGDPQLAKQIFTTSPDELGNIQPNLSRLFGSGSVFALDGRTIAAGGGCSHRRSTARA